MTSFLLTSLNLLLLYQGTLTIHPGYSISVPKKVLVEINHCTDVPCLFTVPEKYSKSSAPFYIYWFKSVKQRYYLLWINIWVQGDLMVTNDLRQKAEITDFKLTGDPKNGNCSFSIANAQPVDSGKYYMRIDKGPRFRYVFASYAPEHHINPQIVVTDLKKPMIWKPPSIIWGETIHFSCVASNSCLNPKPKILWSIKSSHWNMSDWATRKSNWTWTYGANLSFVPSLANEGLILTCHLKYPATRKLVQNAVQLHMAYSPQIKVLQVCKYDQNSTTTCSCAFHSWPPPEIQWYMNYQHLTEKSISEDIRIVTSTQGNTRISSLYLLGNTLNSHMISCRGINAIGFSNLKTLSIPAMKVKKRKNIRVAAVLLGTLVSVLMLISFLYYFFGQ